MKSRGLSGKRTDQREGALGTTLDAMEKLTLGACSQIVFSIWELGSSRVSPKAKGLQGFGPLTGSDRVRKGEFGALPQ